MSTFRLPFPFKPPTEPYHELLARNPTRAPTHQSLIFTERLIHPYPMRSDLVLPQMLVMITTSHLQDTQRPTHRGLDLHPAKSYYGIHHETQPYISDRVAIPYNLGILPEQHGTDPLGLQEHNQSVDLPPYITLRNKHLEMTKRINDQPSRVKFSNRVSQ